ncbi:hypothetical protein P376_2190 [Streptomyces sp. HCCB10043]|nr:hypothetical protein P376_2190 [Streptomyces sp. HCCB10043]
MRGTTGLPAALFVRRRRTSRPAPSRTAVLKTVRAEKEEVM